MHPFKKGENSWYSRKSKKRILLGPERHLIVCQGEKTEPSYFNGIQDKINSKFRNSIFMEILSDNSSCIDMLNTAIIKVSDDRLKQIKYKHVWLVYDKDDFPSDDFDNIVLMVKTINDKNIEEDNDEPIYHVLWSNQCIEFWFLLHFIDLRADIDRKEYIKKLNENFKKFRIEGKYKKNDTLIYQKLEKYQEDAIKRAKDIIEENKDKVPSNIKPGTNVYEIIEYLKAYL